MPPSPSLRRTAITGVRWTSASAGMQALLGLVQIAVLARLLSPVDFGLVATTVVVIGVASIFTDLGLNNAIIARQTRAPDVLSSLYWANILAGAAAALVVVAGAPLIADLFGEDRLVPLLRWAALGFVAIPLGQQFQILLQRDLRFDLIARVEMVATVAGFAVAISTAIAGAGALSLVWGLLSSAVLKAVVFAHHGWDVWRPALRLRTGHLRGYLSFGLYQIGERLTNYAGANVDYLLVGAYLGPEALGAYFIAYQLCVKPMLLINPPLTRVAFPVFAQRQRDDGALAKGFLEMTRLIALLAFPILTLLAVAAGDIVPVVFGDQWGESVLLIQALAGVGLIKAITNPTGSLLLAKNRPDLGFKYTLAGATVLAVVLRVAVESGVTAVAFSFLGFAVLNLALWPLLLRHVVGLPPRRYAAALAGPAGYALAMAAAMVVALTFIPGGHETRLAVAALIGAGTYGGLVFAFERRYVGEILGLLMRRRAVRDAVEAPVALPA